VVLFVADSEDEVEWARLTHEQFLQGYDASDGIYDALHAG